MKRLVILLLLLFCFALQGWADGSYPARCRVTTNLNVRSNPSKNASKIGLYRNGEYITVDYTTGYSYDQWGAVNYGTRRGYVSMRYVTYIEPINDTPSQQITQPKKSKSGIAKFFAGVWKVVKTLLWVVAIILVLALWEYILELAIYAGLFAGCRLDNLF